MTDGKKGVDDGDNKLRGSGGGIERRSGGVR